MKQSRTKVAQLIASKTLRDGISESFSQSIAAYLLAERRITELDSLLRDIQGDWAQDGYVEVIVSSVHPLNDTLRQNITKTVQTLYPSAQKIIITERRDETIRGGLRLNFADAQLDLSIAAKLNKFKQLTTV